MHGILVVSSGKHLLILLFFSNGRYDGQRAQIHKSLDGSIHIFSRNGDETTSRFPDVVAIIYESCKPSAITFILDAEVRPVHALNGKDHLIE